MEPTRPLADDHLRIGMLRETHDLALEVAGDLWPTPAMALGNLFERGVAVLDGGGAPSPIRGAAPPDLLEALNATRAELFLTETQLTFTKYVAYVLHRRNEELEATWLELADQHLALRARIVACRGEEERLKRELAALGASTVPLPEHEVLPEPGPDRPRKSRGMYADLFVGVATIDAELTVAPATLARADELARERGWAEEWQQDARLVVFAHGLSLALREREADGIDPDDEASVRAGHADARGRLMGLEGRYATLRFRLFELRHNARILGWRITALRVEAEGLQHRLELFAHDRGRLEVDLAARRAARPSPGAGARPSWRARLGRLFGAERDP